MTWRPLRCGALPTPDELKGSFGRRAGVTVNRSRSVLSVPTPPRRGDFRRTLRPPRCCPLSAATWRRPRPGVRGERAAERHLAPAGGPAVQAGGRAACDHRARDPLLSGGANQEPRQPARPTSRSEPQTVKQSNKSP
eukprot:251790-Prorocentrum_minimum.AAC.6